jgi:hypothetical protein
MPVFLVPTEQIHNQFLKMVNDATEKIENLSNFPAEFFSKQ